MVNSKEEKRLKHNAQQKVYNKGLNTKADNGDPKAIEQRERNRYNKAKSAAFKFIPIANDSDFGKIKELVKQREEKKEN